MSNQKKQERKCFFNKGKLEMINALIGILSFLGSLMAFFCKLLFKYEFPKIIFIALLAMIFYYVFKIWKSIIRGVLKSIKDYFYKSDCLYRNSENDEEKKKELYYEKMKLRKKTARRLRRYILPRLIRIIMAGTLIIFLCFVNPLNVKAFWEDIQEIIAIIFDQSSEDIPESHTEQDNSDVELDTENDNLIESIENEKERKPPGYRFILSYPDKIFTLDRQIKAQVYFFDNDGLENSIDVISFYFSNSKENRKTGLIIEDNMKDKENEFKSEVAKYINIEYIDDWYEVAPSSDKLDEYIQKRKEDNELKKEGKQGCYVLWWRLANDYQYYALEYEMQTNNETAVLYYYTMSIYCCMEALKYEMSDEMYNMIYHYMATRYHDIFRYDCIIPNTYKKRAEVIYYVMEPDAEY